MAIGVDFDVVGSMANSTTHQMCPVSSSPSADRATDEPSPSLGEEGVSTEQPTFPADARGW